MCVVSVAFNTTTTFYIQVSRVAQGVVWVLARVSHYIGILPGLLIGFLFGLYLGSGWVPTRVPGWVLAMH